jgi:pyruvate decarboxylase
VIRECYIQSGPVYIYLPLDLSTEYVPSSLLDNPIDLSPKVDISAQEKAVAAIRDALLLSKNPCLLIDALVHRFDAAAEVKDVTCKLGIRFYSSIVGKGVIDEDDPLYIGLYNGAISAPGVEAAWMESDLTILLGCLPSDTNSGGFSRKIDPSRTIEINPFDVVVWDLIHL